MSSLPSPGADAAAARDVIVFVGGCERSGTTIISRLLAEHSSLVVLPEAYFHAVAYRRFGSTTTARMALRHWRRRSWGLRSNDLPAEDDRLAPYLRDRMADIYASRRGARSPIRVVECSPPRTSRSARSC
ncbi:MAG: sulfotransferase [Acidimicrobiales bacterium]